MEIVILIIVIIAMLMITGKAMKGRRNRPPEAEPKFDTDGLVKALIANAQKSYQKSLEKIEAQWPVTESTSFEKLCKDNIKALHEIVDAGEKYYEDEPKPETVPAYKYLIEMYEKQGRTDEAIELCKDAVSVAQKGFGNKSEMSEILAKLETKQLT